MAALKEKEKRMPYQELDYERLIIQKLENMEDFLKSFMSSLEEPPERKGGILVPVEAPTSGKILQWLKASRMEVEEYEPLCRFESELDGGRYDIRFIDSPARGVLFIHIGPGVPVSRGTKIALIKTAVPV